MKTFLFTVPRKKEQEVDKFLDLLNQDIPIGIRKFHGEKWRIGQDSIYTIYYEEDIKKK